MKNGEAIVVILISVLAFVSVMLIVQQHVALAYRSDVSWTIGYNSSNPDQDDSFCQCVHTDYNHTDDTWVALGLFAHYNFSLANSGIYKYDQGQWSFEAGYGGQGYHLYSNYSDHTCDYDINQYGYYSGTEFFNTASFAPHTYFGVNAWFCDYYYPSPTGMLSLSPSAYSISGESYCAFYDPLHPNNIWYMYATPNPYSVMTATVGPPTATNFTTDAP
ncbi:MAG TPA: hypothetical protein VMD05_07810 [Candidatus Nanoarchaeia archaeon]|nr:hypothetical protein [Candidatus Nanoarchaeia archaeon]